MCDMMLPGGRQSLRCYLVGGTGRDILMRFDSYGRDVSVRRLTSLVGSRFGRLSLSSSVFLSRPVRKGWVGGDIFDNLQIQQHRLTAKWFRAQIVQLLMSDLCTEAGSSESESVATSLYERWVFQLGEPVTIEKYIRENGTCQRVEEVFWINSAVQYIEKMEFTKCDIMRSR